MLYELRSEDLIVKVSTLGAELTSVIDVSSDFEYIYDANPKFWKRHAPNLFPIVGRLKEDTYFYKGKEYQMTQHGFARDCDFELVEQTKSRLVFELTENEETLKKYPFKFTFSVIYLLNQDALTIAYGVKNEADEEMYFSVGAHPAFVFDQNQTIDDYLIEFQHKIRDERLLLEGSYISKKKVGSKQEIEKINLNMDTFKDDALVFDQAISGLTLKSTVSNHQVAVYMEEMPYLGIWTSYQEESKTPFVCIEPWDGLADYIDSSQKLEEKVGIKKLAGHQSYSTHFIVRFRK